MLWTVVEPVAGAYLARMIGIAADQSLCSVDTSQIVSLVNLLAHRPCQVENQIGL